MPTMRERDKVIAILVSDIHLSQKAPRARRKEDSWFEAMRSSLQQLQQAAVHFNAPILCAGDLFDHWRASPELINFAINYLPEMYAIPGQHDLPLHNIDLIKRSAYWTMVLCGRVHHVEQTNPLVIENDIVLHGFPWDTKIEPFEGKSKKLHVALCHDYFWTDAHCYHTAPEDAEASKYRDKIKGWHAVAFGDNHKGFITKVNGIEVMNCGGFMRRKSDEKDYLPQVGLLCASGQIISHKLKVGHERFTTLQEEEEGLRKMLRVNDLQDFLMGLEDLQHKTFDFVDAIELAMKDKMIPHRVRRLILEALERDI